MCKQPMMGGHSSAMFSRLMDCYRSVPPLKFDLDECKESCTESDNESSLDLRVKRAVKTGNSEAKPKQRSAIQECTQVSGHILHILYTSAQCQVLRGQNVQLR